MVKTRENVWKMSSSNLFFEREEELCQSVKL